MQPSVRAPQEMPNVTAIASTSVVFPDPSVLEAVAGDLQANSATYQAALAELQTMNLQIRAEAAAPFGWSTRDQSVAGPEVQALTFVQDLGSDGEQDFGLIGVIVRGTETNGLPVQREMFELVTKPTAGVADPSEVSVVATFRDGGAITPGIGVASIFSRFIKCVQGSCVSTCLGALTACAGAFPVYLKCVALACGGCALKCGACAACDCSFWCRWGVGCCED
jgi:hypothetical protein